jgi:L-asparagine transporter-like permease
VSAVARLVVYLGVCLSTLVLRGRTPTDEMAEATFRTPGGPVIPVIASIIAVAIIAGATQQQLVIGGIALVVGAILYLVAPRKSEVATHL